MQLHLKGLFLLLIGFPTITRHPFTLKRWNEEDQRSTFEVPRILNKVYE